MGWQDRSYNQDNHGGIPPVRFTFPALSRLTIVLLAVNVGLFLLKISGSAYTAVLDAGELTFGQDAAPWWQVWRWVTYQYLHGSGGHVFFNMLALYFFLPALEQRWGWRKALGFYTLGGIAAGFTFLLLVAMTSAWGLSLIGASGSVLAAMGGVALLYPERQLVLLIFCVPIRVAVVLIGSLYLLTVVGDRNFSNAAHLGGLVFGFFAPWIAGPWLSHKQRSIRQWQEQRIVQSEVAEQQEVDRILAKVADSGMNSLSSAEKKALARATENQRVRDQQRARRGSVY
ncbi:MAG: rhomboid family intramembrane serine protease [Burkholderiales bacterium]|nr:rhomboid family intramembrane serine protease [Phycisphaerae bacterium]